MPKRKTRMQELREQAGMRHEELAYRAGISTTYVRVLERGRTQPGVDVARRVAAALGAPLDIVFPEKVS